MRVLLCDDHPGYRMMLSVFMASDPELELVGEAASIAQLLDLAEYTPFDLALVDLRLSDGGSGLDAIRALRAEHPDARILAVSSSPPAEVADQAVEAGADAFVEKRVNAAETIRALKQAARPAGQAEGA